AAVEPPAPTAAAGPRPAPRGPATSSRRGSRARGEFVRPGLYPTPARLNGSQPAGAKVCTNAPNGTGDACEDPVRPAPAATAPVGSCVILPRVLSAAAPYTREAERLLRASGHFNWSTVSLLALVVFVFSLGVERANWRGILA